MSDINVLSRTQIIVVDPVTNSVAVINAGPQGPAGVAGIVVPPGGTTGQVLAKRSNADGDVHWITPT